MKIQYKLSLTMILLSLVLLIVIAGGFDYLNHHSVFRQTLLSNEQIAQNVAHHVEFHLESSIDTSLTLSSSPIIHQALVKSNSEFDQIGDSKRQEKIAALNKKWLSTGNLLAPFIQRYLGNDVAQFFRHQHELLVGRYGEIFLTNRHGVLIASSGKLTTLFHGDKNWWQASYNNGKGRIFLDDRGFDTSVEGYVLGIVVPIYNGSEVIGILKCNINILGPLKHIVDEFAHMNHGIMKIVRTNGLILIAPDAPPFAKSVTENILPLLKQKTSATLHENEKLVATTPLTLTLGSEKIGFGGTAKAPDHINGNTGEAWHVVIVQDEATVLVEAHKIRKVIIIAVLIVGLFVTLTSLIWGRILTTPLTKLSQTAKKIGQGNLEIRVAEKGRDEISNLAHSLNDMADNLKKTMASRQDLLVEMERRIETEKELAHQAKTDELTGLFNRRAYSEQMKREVERANRYDTPLCLLMFDIDYFKKVNDTYGHEVGDFVLTEVARISKNTMREQDVVARWGGEEFMVILPHTEQEGALKIAERLRSAIGGYDFAEPKQVTVSIGVTERKAGDSYDSLISRVDLALYEAKSAGRNRVEVAS